MFYKVLLGYDGSYHAQRALMTALDLAQKYKAEVTAVSVVQVPDFACTRDEVNGVLEEAQSFFVEALEQARITAAQRGVALSTRVVPGHPADKLASIADEEGYNLIILGARGLSRIKRFLLGSVSESVVRIANCPVLIVKEG